MSFLWKDKKMLHNGKGLFLTILETVSNSAGYTILPNKMGLGNLGKKQKYLA